MPRRRSAPPSLRATHAKVAQEDTTVSSEGPARGIPEERLAQLPTDPGVYVFKDAAGKVIHPVFGLPGGVSKPITPELRDRFVEVNGCTPQDPPEPGLNSGTHICTSYEGCSEGHPVRWCAHGGDHNPTEKDQGQSESWVPGEAWAFISQF